MKYNTKVDDRPGTKIAEGNDKLILYRGHWYDWFGGHWRYLY